MTTESISWTLGDTNERLIFTPDADYYRSPPTKNMLVLFLDSFRDLGQVRD